MSGGKWGDRMKRMKLRHFVGREREISFFRSLLLQPEREERVVHLHGPGGNGKSTLLDVFALLAAEQGFPYAIVDSRDFPHTPDRLCGKLLNILDPRGTPTPTSPEESLALCLERLADLIEKHGRVLLAIDTCEEMSDLDDWVRETFVPAMPDGVLLVLAGRLPLGPGWMTVDWRPYVLDIALTTFDRETCRDFAAKVTSGQAELNAESLARLFALTKGHPLTLSLMLGLADWKEGTPDDEGLHDVLRHAVSAWLREVQDPFLREMVEAAAIVRIFNQELLELMLDKPIPVADFERLTSLSFVRSAKRGWFIHDLLRGPLSREAKRRQPLLHESMLGRCLAYLNRQLAQPNADGDGSLLLLDLIYVLGGTMLRSIFLDETGDNVYYLKPLRADGLHEAEAYMQRVLDGQRDVVQHFYDPHTHERYDNVMPFAYIRSAYRLLNLKQWAAFGEDVVQVIRNERHEAVALIVFVPIHRDSLPSLAASPVSGPYFRSLRDKELEALAQPPSAPAGWFLYHVDQWGDHSSAARAAFFQFTIGRMIRPGIFVHSSPLKLHQDVSASLGMAEVPAAVHLDYGESFPSRTFVLDTRGGHGLPLMHKFAGLPGGSRSDGEIPAETETAAETRRLTPREQEIAEFALQGWTNAEIAKRLYLSEITVKKHLANVYAKLGVKGKTQLVQYMMSRRDGS